MLKILTIDDHEVVRRGIKEMFTEESATFGEARSGAEAITLALAFPTSRANLDSAFDSQ